MKTLKVRIIGTSPLLMHSDRSIDKTSEESKAHRELTSKRKKTDDDEIAIAKSEFLLSMYHDPELGPFLPGKMIWASLVEGARENKRGKDVESGTLILADKCKLKYTGPRDKEGMWKDKAFLDARSVVVQRSRIMRYRPKFLQWEVEAEVQYDPLKIDESDLLTAFDNAGKYKGIGDFRPSKKGSFGRFTVEVIR
jgi:hypothetical protein